jgi:hypothetical protein
MTTPLRRFRQRGPLRLATAPASRDSGLVGSTLHSAQSGTGLQVSLTEEGSLGRLALGPRDRHVAQTFISPL